MSFHDRVLGMLQELLDKERVPAPARLYQALRLLAKYRSELIANQLVRTGGRRVRSGPFEGMTMARQRTEGCLAPKLLGCYEQELHDVLRALPDRGYQAVINIGCAEGYYAVGLARLLSQATVFAYDVDPAARRTCCDLAEENGVSSRVVVGAELRGEDFAGFADVATLLVCDIEGAELELVEPATAPALRGMDILIELHDRRDRPEVSGTLTDRFAASHEIELIRPGRRDIAEFPELASLEHLDQLLAFWEWRTTPTPWAFMTARRDSA